MYFTIADFEPCCSVLGWIYPLKTLQSTSVMQLMMHNPTKNGNELYSPLQFIIPTSADDATHTPQMNYSKYCLWFA